MGPRNAAPELLADELLKISRAIEGITAFEASLDGYCACGPSKPCYLHGVLIPEAVEAAERIAQTLGRKAFPPKQRLTINPEPLEVVQVLTCTGCRKRAPWCSCGKADYV